MKDKNLWIAKENGIPVPDFIVLKSAELNEGLKKIDSKITLSGDCFAVRSACNLEDGSKDSFAGQFDTYLNVTRNEIAQKVSACVESLHSEKVLKYLEQRGINPKTLNMNVIVQKMLAPQLSGVIFTANPQGLLNESVIVVGKGTGDMIVTDQVETSSYYYNLTDDVYYRDGRNDYLSYEQVMKLIQLSKRICQVFQNDLLDIEYAIENNEIFILQVREITTLSSNHPLILDNSNIVESYPGVSLPITGSFVNLVYSGVFRGLAFRVVKNEKVIQEYEDVFRNMVGSVNGRMYYKISNWYTIIKFLPFNQKIIPIWQEMLGVKTKSYNEEKISLSTFTRMQTYLNAAIELISVPRSMKWLEKEFLQVNHDFYQKFQHELSENELVDLFEEIRSRLLKVWDITLINDLYSFLFTGLCKARIKKSYPDDYERIVGDFISGISNIESMKPVRALAKLAMLSTQPKNQKLYNEKYEEYIRLYGDRYLEELKLESKTFRTDPSLLDQKIAEYARDTKKLSMLLEPKENEKKLAKKDPMISFFAKRAMIGIRNREISRLNRSRIFGMVRGIFLRLSESFVKRGVLEKKEDIYYLTIEEIFDLVKEDFAVKERIEKRKLEYQTYQLYPSYSRLVFSDKEFNKKNLMINSVLNQSLCTELKGIPCSNGIAKGKVLLVNKPQAAMDVKGKILVTKMTDPGWVFLLAEAAGIIVEKGSLLSHTAIVSRELGIPSIVMVENATNLLKNGEMVRMDGGSGTIERIE